MAKDTDDPQWQAVPLPSKLEKQIELDEALSVSELEKLTPEEYGRGEYGTENYKRSEEFPRNYLLIAAVFLCGVLTVAYGVLGWSHVDSVDDVLKLLAPPQAVLTTILGAAVAYYFSKR